MLCYSDQSAFITLKDHKANFKNNTKCRLINPSKSEVGLVSKHYLSSIISTVAVKSGVNQWRNTSTVIKWFENLQNKQKRRFIKFDIADFLKIPPTAFLFRNFVITIFPCGTLSYALLLKLCNFLLRAK